MRLHEDDAHTHRNNAPAHGGELLLKSQNECDWVKESGARKTATTTQASSAAAKASTSTGSGGSSKGQGGERSSSPATGAASKASKERRKALCDVFALGKKNKGKKAPSKLENLEAAVLHLCNGKINDKNYKGDVEVWKGYKKRFFPM